MTSIIFVRTTNAKGQQVSAYIDYAHRLKTEDFGPYFAGEKKLMPKPTDLSYYNWETQASTHNSTPANAKARYPMGPHNQWDSMGPRQCLIPTRTSGPHHP